MAQSNIIQLPDVYKGRPIRQRLPFIMAGDLVVPASTSGRQYADGTFYYAQDLPFEVMRMIPNVTTLDSQGVPQQDPTTTIGNPIRSVQLAIQSIAASRAITLVPTRVSVLVNKDTLAWEFDAPQYLEKGSGYQITVNNLIAVGVAAGGIRMEISFEGSLIDIG